MISHTVSHMKKTIFLFLVIFVGLSVAGRSQKMSFDSAFVHMTTQLALFPQEKIHVHIDKPNYLAGEKVWFRAYVVHSCVHTPMNVSRYVYVDLINPFDSIVSRNRIRESEGKFSGYVNLPENLADGVYTFRAYTSYLKNCGSDYYFKRTIKVGNTMSARVQSRINTIFSRNGGLNVSLSFSNRENGLLEVSGLSVTAKNKVHFPVRLESDTSYYFNISADLLGKNANILVSFQDGSKRSCSKFFRLQPKGDFEISFYPEGGYLLSGCNNRIAFKTIRSDGLDEAVNVDVLNSSGDTISSGVTSVRGMGVLTLFAVPDESYTAICWNNAGTVKKIALPAVSAKAQVLKVDNFKGELRVTINSGSEADVDSLFLVAHVRGAIVYANWLDLSRPFLRFDQRIFPAGVAQFILLDKHLNRRSERLVFVNNDLGISAQLNSTNWDFRSKDLIELNLRVADDENKPLQGSVSVAVVDEAFVPADTAFNIKSILLLTSELKGYIDTPGFFFQNDPLALQGLDLLMMVHGWKRYDVPKVIKGIYSQPSVQPEKSMKIKGSVKSGLLLNSNPGSNVEVSIIGINTRLTEEMTTDERGEFCLDNIEFPDSTGFVVQVLKKKSLSKRLYLNIEDDSIPNSQAEYGNTGEYPGKQFQKYALKTEQLLKSDQESATLINLGEIEIVGNNLSSDLPRNFIDTQVFDSSLIQSYEGLTFREFLEQQMQLIFSGDSPNYRGNPVYFVVDEFNWTFEDLQYDLQMNSIEKIQLIRDADAASYWGGGTNYGATVWIKTKKGMYASAKEQFNLKKISPLGYQRPIEFYSPKYETAQDKEMPDYRTTIYWNPAIDLDREGKASFSFFTGNDPDRYAVVIEGIMDNGGIAFLHKYLLNDFDEQ